METFMKNECSGIILHIETTYLLFSNLGNLFYRKIIIFKEFSSRELWAGFFLEWRAVDCDAWNGMLGIDKNKNDIFECVPFSSLGHPCGDIIFLLWVQRPTEHEWVWCKKMKKVMYLLLLLPRGNSLEKKSYCCRSKIEKKSMLKLVKIKKSDKFWEKIYEKLGNRYKKWKNYVMFFSSFYPSKMVVVYLLLLSSSCLWRVLCKSMCTWGTLIHIAEVRTFMLIYLKIKWKI